MAAAAYTGWKNDMLAGKITLMAAAGNAGMNELSAQARADRVLAGQVEPDGVRLRDGNLAGRGDWIVTRLNERRLDVFAGRDWVKNGDAWEVTRRSEDGSLAVRHLAHGGCLTLPAWYVRDRVQLLYATNAHRAQGATVDTAHPLITADMTREALYVLATRAREKTTLYVATHDLPFDDDARVDLVRRDPRQYAGREVLLNVLAAEGAPLSATETITSAQEEAASLATIVPRYLHAAHQDADARYKAAAIRVLGEDVGNLLAADPAWSAVVRRLFDAESDGWEPARLLATVAFKRELASADSVAEVLAWRIDTFLDDNHDFPQPVDMSGKPTLPHDDPLHQPDCLAYEGTAEACQRLSALAVTTLGGQLADRAQAEAAWPALIAALRRAENAGYSPTDAITRVAATRELRTAPSVSEVLAWRINRHLAAHSADDQSTATGPGTASLLPWVPGPRQVPPNDQAAPLTVYLSEAADLITTRIQAVADIAVRLRQPWTSALGQPSAEPACAREWLRHVAVVAAYREQHKITSDDPRQVLGPYAEPGHAGHKAYWHAAESVLAARQFAGLEPADDTSAESQASMQLASDIFRNLPDQERATVAELVAATPGGLWLGDAANPDERTAAQPAYARQMTRVLSNQGHLTGGADAAPGRPPAGGSEPVEADLARRGRSWRGKTGHPEKRSERESGSQDWKMPPVMPHTTLPTIGPITIR
jgi:hypothetical protein